MSVDWEEYWSNFKSLNKLEAKVNELDDLFQGKQSVTKTCRQIFEHYDEYLIEWENVRRALWLKIEELPGIHLQTSRVKTLDSILRKVIEKKYERGMNPKDPYSSIDSENFKDILTDLVGIRLIISYRGKWSELHNSIMNMFPYDGNLEKYKDDAHVPHPADGSSIMAAIPVANHAPNDNLEIFKAMNIKCKQRSSGYRSVHYVVSFMRTYVEIQTRTIYDEAWSDCDHSYVYKHNENESHPVLMELSNILAGITNSANDLGEEMGRIFEHESASYDEELVLMPQEDIDSIDSIYRRIEAVVHEMECFKSKIYRGKTK